MAHPASAPEWLQPYLTGEAAAWQPRPPLVVLLSRREVHYLSTDRYSVVVQHAVRANTREGTERLGVRLPYNPDNYKVISLKAWVVSPQGKVVSIPRQEFSDVSASSDASIWVRSRAFVFNAATQAEPGCVVAYEYRYEAPVLLGEDQWAVTPAVSLFAGNFEVFPAPGCKLTWFARDSSLPAPSAGATPDSLVWHLDKMKPMHGTHPQGYYPLPMAISVRCVPTATPQPAPTESWEAFSQWWVRVFDEKAVVDASLRAAANAEVKPGMSRWEKVRALSQLVQRKITYLSLTEEADVFAGCRPHPATEVFARQLGDCKDKVTLLIALLRAVGEDGAPALVAAGFPTAVDAAWPAQRFNHVIVAMRSDADAPKWWPTITGPDGTKYVLFDPTARSLPLGCLPPMDEGGQVLLLLPSHGGLARVDGNYLPGPAIQVAMKLDLHGDGSAKISEVDESFGTEAGIMHDMIDQLGKDQFTRTLEQIIRERGVEARALKWTEDWDSVSAHSTLHISYAIAAAVRKLGKDQLLFTPPLSTARASLLPWETNHPGVSWLRQVAFLEHVETTLPAGVAPQELPSRFHVENGGAEATIDYAQHENRVVCTQAFTRPAGLYEKPEYEELRQIAEKAGSARRRPIILSAPAATVAATETK